MEKLLELIKQNPNAEILILCGDESISYETEWRGWLLKETTICAEKLAFYHGEYFDDKEVLQDAIEDNIEALYEELDKEEFNEVVRRIMKKHPFKEYITIRLVENRL